MIDLETGIVRDMNTVTGYCGVYCFHDGLTDHAYNLGEDFINGVHFTGIKQLHLDMLYYLMVDVLRPCLV